MTFIATARRFLPHGQSFSPRSTLVDKFRKVERLSLVPARCHFKNLKVGKSVENV